MDLTKQPPRRPSNTTLIGLACLARMADKARATRNETQGDYLYGMESGLDETLLTFLGISEEDFADAAERYDDTRLGEWVQKASGKTDADIAAFNKDILSREPQSEGGQKRLQERIAKYASGRTDIKTVAQSLELEDWGNFREVDLTLRPPCTPYNRSVAGLYAAARMAEKARAAKIDKRNDYIYNCPIDQDVLAFLGITADAFQDAAWHNPNAIELGDWVRDNTRRTQAEIAHFNYRISHKRPDNDRGKAIFKETLDRVAPGRTDVTTWFDLLDLDDEHDYGLVDLSRHAPRSPYDTSVLGALGLARMIDKGRASLTGTLGNYFFGEDSGFDRGLLGFLGLSAGDFRDALKTRPTDDAVAEWVQAQCKKTDADIAAFNTEICAAGPRSDRQKTWLRDYAGQLDPDRADIACFPALMQLDDLVAFARQKAGV